MTRTSSRQIYLRPSVPASLLMQNSIRRWSKFYPSSTTWSLSPTWFLRVRYLIVLHLSYLWLWSLLLCREQKRQGLLWLLEKLRRGSSCWEPFQTCSAQTTFFHSCLWPQSRPIAWSSSVWAHSWAEVNQSLSEQSRGDGQRSWTSRSFRYRWWYGWKSKERPYLHKVFRRECSVRQKCSIWVLRDDHEYSYAGLLLFKSSWVLCRVELRPASEHKHVMRIS